MVEREQSVARWLRRYATSRNVASSISDEVIEFFFNLPNPSSHIKPWGLLSLWQK
jgi:hypothetical protein